MADQNEASVRAKLYAKLYYLPRELLDKKTIQQLKNMIKNTSYDICNKTMKLFKRLEQKLGKKMNNMATQKLRQKKEFRVDNKEREVHDKGPGDELGYGDKVNRDIFHRKKDKFL